MREQDVPRVFVTRLIPEAGLALLEGQCQWSVWPGDEPPDTHELTQAVAGCAGILALLTDRIDGALMDAAGPQLRVVSTMAVGYDNIDVGAAQERGIVVGNTPGVLTETTADLAFALLAGAARCLVAGMDYVRAGRWVTWGPRVLLGHDLHGATLGLVGFGRIGQAMARRASGFGMRILFSDPHEHLEAARAFGAKRVALDELLTQSDFVSLHAPATPASLHLIGVEQLKQMKRSAILVNTARGSLVDHQALLEALEQGEIAGAALDVTDPEPLPVSHPLLALDNCLVVPHIGSASVATRDRMAVMAARNLLAGLRGEPLPNPVTL
jgi:glyoxylate reductase